MTLSEFRSGFTGLFNKTHDKLVASNGTVVVTGTNPTAIEAKSLMGISDCTISACTGQNAIGGTVNFVSTYGWTTIGAGIPIIAPDGFIIKSVTLASGSLAAY